MITTMAMRANVLQSIPLRQRHNRYDGAWRHGDAAGSSAEPRPGVRVHALSPADFAGAGGLVSYMAAVRERHAMRRSTLAEASKPMAPICPGCGVEHGWEYEQLVDATRKAADVIVRQAAAHSNSTTSASTTQPLPPPSPTPSMLPHRDAIGSDSMPDVEAEICQGSTSPKLAAGRPCRGLWI